MKIKLEMYSSLVCLKVGRFKMVDSSSSKTVMYRCCMNWSCQTLILLIMLGKSMRLADQLMSPVAS